MMQGIQRYLPGRVRNASVSERHTAKELVACLSSTHSPPEYSSPPTATLTLQAKLESDPHIVAFMVEPIQVGLGGWVGNGL